MNDEQWKFFFKHYPEYGAAPYDMMIWLYSQIYEKEQVDNMKNTQPGMDGDTLPEDNFDNNLGKKYDKAKDLKKE